MTAGRRYAYIAACLMVAASAGSMLARPTAKAPAGPARSALDGVVPKQFGGWRELPQDHAKVVNPQTQEILDRLYSEIVSRVYVDGNGYRIMLSLAYGSDQRGTLQAHKPEVCYPAQGFLVQRNSPATVKTAYGEVPVRRLFATMGARQEPITYWFTVGDRAVRTSFEKRVVDLRFGLTGRIPDGLLFRVSSIDADLPRAYEVQDQFINQLLDSVTQEGRRRLAGFGDT